MLHSIDLAALPHFTAWPAVMTWCRLECRRGYTRLWGLCLVLHKTFLGCQLVGSLRRWYLKHGINGDYLQFENFYFNSEKISKCLMILLSCIKKKTSFVSVEVIMEALSLRVLKDLRYTKNCKKNHLLCRHSWFSKTDALCILSCKPFIYRS